jgi:hypothetical protein
VISGVEFRGAVSLSGSPLVVFALGLFLCPGLLFFNLLARLVCFSARGSCFSPRFVMFASVCF